MSTSQWEIVHNEPLNRVRRFRVTGGWLYQTEVDLSYEKMVDGEPPTRLFGWSAPPVFVPERMP